MKTRSTERYVRCCFTGTTFPAVFFSWVPLEPQMQLPKPKLEGVWLRNLEFHRRSEEHTSELQSPCNLVCRLLLEKKKRSIYSSHVAEDRRAFDALTHMH